MTNIAAGNSEQCNKLVEKNGIDVLIDQFDETVEIVEQVLWALGNMAVDNSYNRDMIIAKNGISLICKFLVKMLNEGINAKIINLISWVLSSLCRGQPLPNFYDVSEAVIMLCEMLGKRMITN